MTDRAGAAARLSVAVIGGGPAGLMAAETLARGGAKVTVFERMPSVGRKLLLAGRSGLNLTHAEPFEQFVARYGPAAPWVRPALDAFPPDALRAWAAELGQETFIGSSGRVFPVAWKASPLLRAWLARLDHLGVVFALRHRWTGVTKDGGHAFAVGERLVATATPDAVVMALGGGSWPRLGSDGAWMPLLRDLGIGSRDLGPANCGLLVRWSEIFRSRFEGMPLKRLGLAFRGRMARGDVVITAQGVEGGAVYPLSSAIAAAAAASGHATLRIDLRPDVEERALAEALGRPRGGRSLSTHLRKTAGLSPPAVAILREALGTKVPQDAAALAMSIKSLPLRIEGAGTLARAISSSGGIRLDEVDESFMLKRRPGWFVAGEMIDWDAPTGGYLLQACLATGVAAGRGASDWLRLRGAAV